MEMEWKEKGRFVKRSAMKMVKKKKRGFVMDGKNPILRSHFKEELIDQPDFAIIQGTYLKNEVVVEQRCWWWSNGREVKHRLRGWWGSDGGSGTVMQVEKQKMSTNRRSSID
ncbi:hypothetical protein L6452_21756 [Arctium lappa]|uniref:Uncharacterized protein n=1 Tax=Arctium lappa TaxID=4217 RepID=A0ACB9AYK5_ARCLA|nr:hypothetical protein L6452_21756 [Arctium lappa]